MTIAQKKRYLAIKRTKDNRAKPSEPSRAQAPRFGHVSVGHGAYLRAMQDASQ